MAIIRTNLEGVSSFPNAGAPPDWTNRWNTSTAWESRHRDSFAWAGRTGIICTGKSGNARRFLSYDPAGTINERVQVLGRFMKPTNLLSGGVYGGIVVFGSGVVGSETGYVVRPQGLTPGTDTLIGVTRYLAGAAEVLGNAALAFTADQWVWILTEVDPVADTVKAKAWPDGGAPPGGWMVDVEDANISSGLIGIWDFSATFDAYCDHLVIATDTDDAPLAPTAPAPPRDLGGGSTSIVVGSRFERLLFESERVSAPDGWTHSRFRIDDEDSFPDPTVSADVEVPADPDDGYPSVEFTGRSPGTYYLQEQRRGANGDWGAWSIARAVALRSRLVTALVGPYNVSTQTVPAGWSAVIGTVDVTQQDDRFRFQGNSTARSTLKWIDGPEATKRVVCRIVGNTLSSGATMIGTGTEAADRNHYALILDMNSSLIQLRHWHGAAGNDLLQSDAFTFLAGSLDSSRVGYIADIEITETVVRARVFRAYEDPPAWMLSQPLVEGGTPGPNDGGWVGVGPASGMSVAGHQFGVHEIDADSPAIPDAPLLEVAPGDTFAQLSTSDFASEDEDDVHALTTWQIAGSADTGFTSPVEVVSAEALIVLLYTLLDAGTEYRSRARHHGAGGGVSPWSNVVVFETAAALPQGDQPELALVAATQDSIEVSISEFAHSEGVTTEALYNPETNALPYWQSTEWRIRLQSEPWTNPIAVIEGETLSVSTLRFLFPDLDDDTAFAIGARQRDGHYGVNTPWSEDLLVSTLEIPVVAPDQPAVEITVCSRGEIKAQSSAYSHPESSVHQRTQWRYGVLATSGEVETFDSGDQLLEWVFVFPPPGPYWIAARYQDAEDRWGPWSEAELCVVEGRVPTPIFTAPVPGAVITDDVLVVWVLPVWEFDEEEPVWTYDIDFSFNDGLSWSSIVIGQAESEYLFAVFLRPNGNYILRVRARDPDTGEVGFWAHMPLRIDRTGVVSANYDFTTMEELPVTARAIWDPEIEWELFPGLGLRAINLSTAGAWRRGALVFDELGEPIELDMTTVLTLLPRENVYHGWRFTNMFGEGGDVFWANDGTPGVDRGGVAVGLNQSAAFPYKRWMPYSPDTVAGCPGWVCASFCGIFGRGAADFWNRTAQRSQPNRITQYGWGQVTRGKSRLSKLRPASEFVTGTVLQHDTELNKQTGGFKVFTSPSFECDAGPLVRYDSLYVIIKRVRRQAALSFTVETKIFGPGAPSAGWSRVDTLDFSEYGCGACGLSFIDWPSPLVGGQVGAAFTSLTVTVLDAATGPVLGSPELVED